MGKFICSNKYLQHNWIPCEKNTDWDICTECGAMRRFQCVIPASKYDEVGQSWVSEQRHFKPFENIGDKGEQAEELNSKMNAEAILKQLTPRQRKIVKLLERGYNQREIAEKLKVPLRTTKREVARIRQKIIIL